MMMFDETVTPDGPEPILPPVLTIEDLVLQDRGKELETWLEKHMEAKKSVLKLLLLALRRGRWSCATVLLRQDKTLLEYRDDSQQNICFYWADGAQRSNSENIEAATSWLRKHMDVHQMASMLNTANEEGSTVWHALAATGQHRVMLWMLDMLPGFDVNQANRYGYTALHKAARYGQRSTVQWLLHQGADICLLTVNGDRAEHEALKSGHVALASFIRPTIDWSVVIDANTQIAWQVRFDRAQATQFAFPKSSSIVAVSDAVLAHVACTTTTNTADNLIAHTLYRQAMGYAAAACVVAKQHAKSDTAFWLWSRYAYSQRLRILAHALPESTHSVPDNVYDSWTERLAKLRANCVTKETETTITTATTMKTTNSCFLYPQIAVQLTTGLCGFLESIWSFVMQRLPPCPCSYAMLLLGADITPYGNVKAACLIAENSSHVRNFFVHACSMFEVKGHYWQLLDRQILLHSYVFAGSEPLFATYQKTLRQCLDSNLQSWLSPRYLREDLALELVRQVVEGLHPMVQAANALQRGRVGVSVKEQLFLLPQQMLLALVLFYRVKKVHLSAQLIKLRELKALSFDSVQHLEYLLCQALHWSFVTQLHYESAYEWLHQPNTQFTPSEIRPYVLSSKEQDVLKGMFGILWPLYQCAKQWEQEASPQCLKKAILYQPDAIEKARFNDIDHIIRWHKMRYCLNPHDLEALLLEVHTHNTWYLQVARKTKYLKTWSQLQARKWAYTCVQSNLSLEVLELCRDLLGIPEDKSAFVEELEVHGRNNLTNTVDRHQLRREWLHNCQQELATYHAQWNTRIQQWSDDKKHSKLDADLAIVSWFRSEQKRGAFASVPSRSLCHLLTLLRPAFDGVTKQKITLLKQCETELGIDVTNNKSSLSRLVYVLLMKHRELDTYQSIYQKLVGIEVRLAFCQNLVILQRSADEGMQHFIGSVLAKLRRLPDQCGETVLWEEGKTLETYAPTAGGRSTSTPK
ncbi:hypothetical protein RFI_22222 [Reticulomyxa filosa]|uniref:Uncharacterized protein n=1 Tax=Reticulomyxa filosa TaxID=46433 RepID=X6MPW8_RETFI|nr:hypothetical protein RFI_22222 [Reticulomyxa filosa]|eukprot:ETO15145.1 hypothetical protein RFI_22222 [Reticulomyxa filosa]